MDMTEYNNGLFRILYRKITPFNLAIIYRPVTKAVNIKIRHLKIMSQVEMEIR